MIEKIFTVNAEEGLHARPASELTKVCQKFHSDIEIFKGEAKANPKSILGILSLGVSKGEKIKVTIDGEDEEKAMEDIEKFFNN